MKVLFVGVRSTYMNPTEELLPALLPRVGNLTTIGPGYGSGRFSERQALREIEQGGPFDVVILDTSTTLLAIEPNVAATSASLQRSTASAAYEDEILAFAELVPRLAKLGPPIVASLARLDPHAWQNYWSRPLLDLADVFLGLDPDLGPSTQDSSAASRDPIFSGMPSDDYYEFARQHRRRLVPWPHFVSESLDAPANFRKRDFFSPRWAVPGVPYTERLEALRQLRDSGVPVRRSHAYRLAALSYRAGWGQSAATRFARSRYVRLLERADVALATGSSLRLPVRKYFEIPASGCLMAAVPFNRMETLGFFPFEHYLPIEDGDLLRTQAWIKEHQREAADIAARGSQLVWKSHSDIARAEFLHAVIPAIPERPMIYWEHGEWVLA